jgi:hypothetical protein
VQGEKGKSESGILAITEDHFSYPRHTRQAICPEMTDTYPEPVRLAGKQIVVSTPSSQYLE